MIKKIIYLATISLFISSETNNTVPDCSAVLCMAPNVVINLVDKSTDSNYILQNSFNEENILIHNATNNIEFHLEKANGWLFVYKKNKEDIFEIQINSEIITTISFETTAPNKNECCDFGVLKNVLVTGKEFVVEENLITIYL